MTLDLAIRATEIILALALIQQSAEHIKNDPHLFIPRILLSALLLIGFQTPWACLGLTSLSILTLQRFQGPYNGGSDRMSLLILYSLTAIHFIPSQHWQAIIFGYLALQLILSYVMAGWVKIINPEWRNGLALKDVFCFSAYPASESLRGWAKKPKILRCASWAVMLFELLFPLTLLSQTTLIIGLVIAITFHIANAFLFGLNRFLWTWLAAYPSILWLQSIL